MGMEGAGQGSREWGTPCAWSAVALLEVALSALSRIPCKLLEKPSELWARDRNIISFGKVWAKGHILEEKGPCAPRYCFLSFN